MRQQLVGMISAKNVLKEPKTALTPPLPSGAIAAGVLSVIAMMMCSQIPTYSAALCSGQWTA